MKHRQIATKDELFEDLQYCIKRMNSPEFGLSDDQLYEYRYAKKVRRKIKEEIAAGEPPRHIPKLPSFGRKLLGREGTKILEQILKRNKVTTICELSYKQLEEAIEYIHKSVIKTSP